MFCTRCGASNKDGARFCGSCGSPMPTATAQAPAVAPAMPASGVYPSAPPAAQPAYAGAPVVAPKAKRSKLPLIIIAIIVVALAVIGAVFAFLRCSANPGIRPGTYSLEAEGSAFTMTVSDDLAFTFGASGLPSDNEQSKMIEETLQGMEGQFILAEDQDQSGCLIYEVDQFTTPYFQVDSAGKLSVDQAYVEEMLGASSTSARAYVGQLLDAVTITCDVQVMIPEGGTSGHFAGKWGLLINFSMAVSDKDGSLGLGSSSKADMGMVFLMDVRDNGIALVESYGVEDSYATWDVSGMDKLSEIEAMKDIPSKPFRFEWSDAGHGSYLLSAGSQEMTLTMP